MNYFFGINNKILNSQLTIPRFQNRGKTQNDFLVYQAEIQNNKWQIEKINCEQNKNFYFINSNLSDNEKIFFLAKDNDIKLFEEIHFSKLLNLNKFTDTDPAFRSNLQIYNQDGGFSSYQSEYPYSMIVKQGSILSPVSALCNNDAEINLVFIKNIYEYPIKKEFKVYFLNIKTRKIIKEQLIYTNYTNEIIIEKDLIKPEIFLYTNKYLGIPMFVSIHNSNISFEHTHPPHEYILSPDKFKKTSELKKEISEIIN